jgi:chaperonin GroEL
MKGSNDDETTGISIIRKAIEEPLRQIVNNCGGDASVVVNKVKEGKDDFGYNARTETYEPLITAGVIDPTKVSRVALQNAASAASMILTTECALINEKEENSNNSTPPMPGGMY